MLSQKYENIIEFVMNNKGCSSTEIHGVFAGSYSLATIKRILQQLVTSGVIEKTGTAKNTRYHVPVFYKLLQTVNIAEYYSKEIDEQKINNRFNFSLIRDTLYQMEVFTPVEKNPLNKHK